MQLFARCVGDPADPMVVYLHGFDEGRSSHDFNDSVLAIAAAMQVAGNSRVAVV